MASFFGNLLSAFTGAPADEAAKKQQLFYQNTLNTGRGDIASGTGNAVGALNYGYGNAQPILANNYNQARSDISGGGSQAINYIDQGTRGATDAYGQVLPKYGGATSLQLDALGVNGPEAQARARQSFQTDPGYQFNLDQQLGAMERARSAGGLLASGNTSADAMRIASGNANQAYGSWMDRLGQYINPELAATSGMANTLSQAGQNKANIASGTGGLLGNLASRYGTESAGLQTGLADRLSGVYTGGAGQNVNLASNLAQPYANTYQQQAQGQMQGSQNLWGLLGGLSKLGVGTYAQSQNPYSNLSWMK